MYDSLLRLPTRSARCRVLCGDGATSQLGAIINQFACSSVFCITDRNVHRCQESLLKGMLRDILPPRHLLVLPAGEKTKNHAVQIRIHNWLLEMGADRRSILIGIGGGVICDISGFAASTFMRGIRHALVPTTLVAQVDAAIGGKNGINLPDAKNVIGTIRQPVSVVADPRFLSTLAPRHINDGLAELIKVAVIRSRPLGRLIELYQSSDPRERDDLLTRMIEKGIVLKLDIVAKDPYETGLRRILNFGHTTGHALEVLGKYGRITHGKAVAFGMLVALELSRRLRRLSDDSIEWVADRVANLYGSFQMGDISVDDTWDTIRRDKKRMGGRVQFVLLESFARPAVDRVMKREFRRAFNSVAKSWSKGA